LSPRRPPPATFPWAVVGAVTAILAVAIALRWWLGAR
jgi:hypothetical protein